jgi:hypothetical protein
MIFKQIMSLVQFQDVTTFGPTPFAFRHGNIAAALVAFAEYQHTNAGGDLSERDAQEEIVRIRGYIPEGYRTEYINNLEHGFDF